MKQALKLTLIIKKGKQVKETYFYINSFDPKIIESEVKYWVWSCEYLSHWKVISKDLKRVDLI